MKANKYLIILLVVIIVSSCLRFWKLANYPIHLSIDEVAIGYSSYSVLKTGRDEHGNFFPLAFKSVGDWKPPVLVYLMVPSLALLGLNELSVRLPIALVGSLTPLVVFFLIKRLTKKPWLGILTAFSVAISPWHIHFSRGSFEAILALFFSLMGTWLFLEAINGRDKLLILSAVSFVFSIYSYHAEKVFVPLFILGLFFIYRQKILMFKKSLILSLVVGFLLILPMGLMMLGPQGQTRALMTFISQDIEISRDLHPASEKLSLITRVLDNNFLILGNFWLKRYLNYWDPVFLFFKGMNLTLPNCPGIGLFHLIELPFFLLGLWVVFFHKNFLPRKSKNLFALWWLLGPLAASLANNEQHALRSLTLIPVLHLIVALGVYFIWVRVVKKNTIKRVIFALIMLPLVLFSLVYYFDLYFIHSPIQFSEYLNFDFKELSLYAWENYQNYDEIIVDYQFGSLGPNLTGIPHYYMLFYGKYDPGLYQKRPSLDSNDFEKFTFRPIHWLEDRTKKNSLFIGSPWSLPYEGIKDEQILKKVYFKNGNLGFLVVESGI